MVILCFGDSLTEGWIDNGKSFHPYTIELTSLLSKQFSNSQVINAGVSGETICKEMMDRLPKTLQNIEKQSLDVLIIKGGTNDILQFSELQTSVNLFEKFRQLLQICIDKDVKRILILTTMEGFFVEDDGATMDHETSNQLRIHFNKNIMENFNTCKLENTKFEVCNLDSEFPYFSLDDDRHKELWDDFLHPTVNGYDIIGSIIFKRLQELHWI